MNLLGISGKKQHGKDTVCQMIQYFAGQHNEEGSFEEYRKFIKENLAETLSAPFAWNGNWKRKLFADKLKDIVCLLIGCTREQLEDDVFKNTPLGPEWNRLVCKYSYDGRRYSAYFNDMNEAIKFLQEENAYGAEYIMETITPRIMLQKIGTEGLRDLIHPNVHVNALFADVDKELATMSYGGVIITDVRFPNELEAIDQRGGLIIRVENPRKVSTDTHPSEISLDNFENFDYHILNDSTLDNLQLKVKNMMEHFNIL